MNHFQSARTMGNGPRLSRNGASRLQHLAGRIAPVLLRIWHRKLIVALVTAVCAIGALVLGFALPRTYTRTCAIVVEPATAKLLADASSMASYRNTQVELITKSTAIHANALS